MSMMKQVLFDKLSAMWQPMVNGRRHPPAGFQPEVRPGFSEEAVTSEKSAYNPTDNHYEWSDFGYTYNSEGYRCDELDPSPDVDLRILFTGCSFTFGVGLPVEHTFPHRIVTRLRDEGLIVPHWNVAHGGTSIDYSIRTLYQFMPRIKPDLVIALFPGHTRREVFAPYRLSGQTCLINYLPNWYRADFDVGAMEDFYIDENVLNCVASNYAFFDTLAMAHKAEYIWANWSYFTDVPDDVYHMIPPRMHERRIDLPEPKVLCAPPMARDLSHWGPDAHLLIADLYYEKMGPMIAKAHERKAARISAGGS